jgi:hemoglobin-like flavoprotein
MDDSTHLLECLERLSGSEQALQECFYALFFERHPEVRELFGEHSLSEQEEMIRETLASVVAQLHDEPWLDGNLEAMGKSHWEYGVEDRMYDAFVTCMLDALEHTCGAGWEPAWRDSWQRALARLTDVMRRAGQSAAAAAG